MTSRCDHMANKSTCQGGPGRSRDLPMFSVPRDSTLARAGTRHPYRLPRHPIEGAGTSVRCLSNVATERDRHGSARTTLRCDAGNAGRSVSSVKKTVHRGSCLGKRAGAGGGVLTLVRNMAGFAVAVAVLTSCAGGGSIEGSAAPSRSASQLPTPTASLPTPTRSAERPENPSPTPTKPSPALSSSRPAQEPTDTQEPTSAPSATTNPSRSPIREETPTTRTQTVTASAQTVNAAPSPSTVTRSVTITPSPTASASPSASPAGEPRETGVPTWFSWALAGFLVAAAVATPLLVRAHHRRLWRADFSWPSKRWRGLPACSSLSWDNRALSLKSEAAGPSPRIAYLLSRIG